MFDVGLSGFPWGMRTPNDAPRPRINRHGDDLLTFQERFLDNMDARPSAIQNPLTLWLRLSVKNSMREPQAWRQRTARRTAMRQTRSSFKLICSSG